MSIVSRSTLGHGMGGMERYVDTQLRAFHAMGLDLSLVTAPGAHAAYIEELANLGIRVTEVAHATPWHYTTAWHRTVSGPVRAARGDVVIFHGLAGLGYERRGSERTITLTHGSAPLSLYNSLLGSSPVRSLGGRLKTLVLQRELARLRSHELVALSEFDARLTALATGQRTSSIAVVPPLVPTAPESSLNREPVIVAAGRVEASKGMKAIVEAWSTIDHHGHSMVIAGDGGLLAELRALAPSDVTFAGRLSQLELSGLMQRSRWTLVGGRYLESFGLSAAESMALGTPVLYRRRGALPEVAGKSGISFLRPQELGAALTQAITVSPSEWAARARASAERASKWSAAEYRRRWTELLASPVR